MIEEGSFWDYEGDREYKKEYGEYKVLSRTVPVSQIIHKGNRYELKDRDFKKIADVGNSDLEIKRGIESVFIRKKENSTFVNLENDIECRVINPTHGRIATSSNDRILICGNTNDIKMTREDYDFETRKGWY